MAAVSKTRDISLLANLVPLGELDHDKLLELADGASVQQFAKGQSVSSGVEHAYIAYLLSGEVMISPNSPQSERVIAESERARHAILAPDKRSRVIAESAVTVLCIDSEILDLLSNWGASNGFVVDEIDAGDSGDWLDSLMQSDTVLSLSSSGIQSIMAAIDPVEIAAGELIFNQGDAPDYYHIISRGRCVITRRAAGQDAPTELAVLGPGDAFGEEALIAGTRRSASARMSEDGLLLRIDQNSFKRLLEQPLVNVVDAEQAGSLKAAGAQLLDIRTADKFASDGDGVNIPFSELRSRIGSLDKDKQYIIVSDDNRASAVAAFLLGQKRFNVDVLRIPDKEEIVAKKYQAVLESLEKKLEQANHRLQQEEHSHAITRSSVRALESDLKKNQANAKKAILEAGALKNQSDKASAKKIEELSQEVESARQNVQSIASEKDALNIQLASLHEELQQARHEIENALPDTVLADVINDNEQQLEMARLGQEQLLTENQALNQQLADARQNYQQYSEELQQLRRCYEQVLEEKESLSFQINSDSQSTEQHAEQLAQLQDSLKLTMEDNQRLSDELAEGRLDAQQQAAELARVRKIYEQNSEETAALQQNHAQLQDDNQRLNKQLVDARQLADQHQKVHGELQRAHEQALSETQSLSNELEDANAKVAMHVEELGQLKENYEKLQKSLDERLADAGLSTDQYAEKIATLTAENQTLEEEKLFFNTLLEELKVTLEEQGNELEGLRKELNAERVDAADRAYTSHERDAMQKDNDDFCEQLADKELKIEALKQGYEKHIAQLEQSLEQELINSSKALEQIEGEFRKEKLRSNTLQEALSLSREEGGRGRRWLWLLVLTAILAVAAGAFYMGVDVHEPLSMFKRL